jgi:hypothetical protein
VTAPLYVREGSRFVLWDRVAQHTPPIPTPVPVEEPVDERPNVTRVPAARCEHGNYSLPGGPGRGCRPCGRGEARRAR